MRLTPDQVKIQGEIIESVAGKVLEAMNKQKSVLDSLIRDREVIRGNISNLKNQLKILEGLETDTEEQIIARKKRVLDDLCSGNTPDFLAHAIKEQKDNISDLQLWKDEVQDLLLRKKADLEAIERQIRDQAYQVSISVSKGFQKTVNKLTVELAALIKGWNKAQTDFFYINEVRAALSCSLRVPYSMAIKDNMDKSFSGSEPIEF